MAEANEGNETSGARRWSRQSSGTARARSTVRGVLGFQLLANGLGLSVILLYVTLLFPPGMTSVSDPYVEVGFGVENIFRLLRVDFIWRVTHRDPKPGQEIQNFAVNLGIKLKF